jgi:hypothetical protein
MAINILGAFQGDVSPFPGFPSKQDQLIAQVSDLAKRKIAGEQKRINQTATDETKSVDRDNDRYISIRAQIYRAQAIVDVGRSNVESIKSTILAMRGTVARAGEAKAVIKDLRVEFDAKMMTINQSTSGSIPGASLIGSIDKLNYTPDSVEYSTGGLGVTALRGTYAGGGYRIEADDGTTWVPDLAVDTIAQFKGEGGERTKYKLSTGKDMDTVTSTRNGLKLKSFDPKTGAITVEVTVEAGRPAQVVTGTLKRSGIKLMQGWFYEGLETQDGRKRAMSDLTRAETELTFADTTLTFANLSTKADARKIDANLKSLSDRTGAIRLRQMEATQKLQNEKQRQMQALILQLGNGQKMQQNYIDAFGAAGSDPFFDILI